MAPSGPSTLGPTTFLLRGPIETIHRASRRLRIASNDLEVSGAIQLERFRVGERVVGHAVRDPVTERMHPAWNGPRIGTLQSRRPPCGAERARHRGADPAESQCPPRGRARISERRASFTTNASDTAGGQSGRRVEDNRPSELAERLHVDRAGGARRGRNIVRSC